MRWNGSCNPTNLLPYPDITLYDYYWLYMLAAVTSLSTCLWNPNFSLIQRFAWIRASPGTTRSAARKLSHFNKPLVSQRFSLRCCRICQMRIGMSWWNLPLCLWFVLNSMLSLINQSFFLLWQNLLDILCQGLKKDFD